MSLEFYVKEFFEKGLYDEFYKELKNEEYYEDVDPLSDIIDYYLWLFRVCNIRERKEENETNTSEKEESKEDELDEENISKESEEFNNLKESLQYLIKAITLVGKKNDKFNKKRVYDEAFRYYQGIDNLDKAKKYLDKLKEIDPKSPMTIENQAFFDYVKGNYKEAADNYEILAKKNENKYIKEYLKCLVKADFLNVSIVEGYINRQENLNKGDNVSNPELHELHSEIYRITFQYKEALKEIEAAIKIDPKNLKYKVDKIRLFYYLQDHKNCIQEGEKFVKEYSDKKQHEIAPVFFYLAIAYGLHSSKGTEYLEEYERYIKRRNSEYYYEMGKNWLMNKEDITCWNKVSKKGEEAKKCFEKSIKIDPSNVFSIQELITIHNKSEKIDEDAITKLKEKNKVCLDKFKEAIQASEDPRDFFNETIDLELQISSINEITQNDLIKEVRKPKDDIESIRQMYKDKEKDDWGNAIIDKVGRGGFGEVRKVYNFGDNEIYAAKYVRLREISGNPKDPTYDSFLKEVSTMIKLNHENLIKIKGYQKGIIYMEYAEGKDVSSLLKRELPLKFKVYLLLGIANGIAALHNVNLVHGDVKCKNVVLNKEFKDKEDYPIPKLCDFGLTGQKGKDISDLQGTLGYLPSEYLINKKIDPKTDVYAFGMTIYELLSGQEPFHNCSKEEKRKNLELHKLPDLSILRQKNIKNADDFISIIIKCTKKEKKERISIIDAIKLIEEIKKKI